MSAGISRPVRPVDALIDSLATPPFGARGNGLPARSWVPLADLDRARADRLLTELADHGLAGCAARVRVSRRRGGPVERVWVDATRYARAQDVARHVLAELPAPAPPAARPEARAHHPPMRA